MSKEIFANLTIIAPLKLDEEGRHFLRIDVASAKQLAKERIIREANAGNIEEFEEQLQQYVNWWLFERAGLEQYPAMEISEGWREVEPEQE